MSTLSALPALHAAAPPDIAGNLERLMAIKSMMGQQQVQQQQVQGLQTQNQMQQIQLQHIQKLDALSPQFTKKDADGNVTGYDFNGLFNAASASGIPPAMLQPIIEAQKNYIGLSDAQITHQQKVNGILTDHLESVRDLIGKNADPNDIIAATRKAITEGQQNGEFQGLDPNSITQPPTSQQLDAFEARLGMHQQVLSDAQKQSETAKNTAQAAEAQSAQWKPVEGTGMFFNPISNQVKTPAGQVMTPAMMQSKYVAIQQSLKMGQPISPDDKAFSQAFEKFKTLVPQFNINMASQLSPQGLDQMATQFAQTGTLPSVGFGAAGTAMRTKIVNRAAEMFPDQSLALAKAAFGSNEGALKHLQTQFATIDAFENTAIKNLDQLTDAAKAVPDLGTRFANMPVRSINENFLGTPEMARFRAALATAQNETAKVLNSANATGVLSDSARGELQQLLSGNLPYPAMESAIKQLKVDMQNRHDSYQEQIDTLKGQIGGAGKQNSGSAAKPAPKMLTMAQITQAAKDHGVSVDEAKRQAQAAGYQIQQ